MTIELGPEQQRVVDLAIRSGAYQVNIGGTVCPATVGLRPPFDPAGERVRGRGDAR